MHLRRIVNKAKEIYDSWKEVNIPEQIDSDYVTWKWRGKVEYDCLVIPHAFSYRKGFLYILNGFGRVKWEKKLDTYPYSFRHFYCSDGSERFAYQKTERITFGAKQAGSLEDTHLVLMNEKLQVIRDNIYLLKGGSIRTAAFPCENHEYLVIGDDHYILTAEKRAVVWNIPGRNNKPVRVFNGIIQEQKNGKVVWQFETKDYPELYEASLLNNDWDEYSGLNLMYSYAADYAHINAVTLAPDGGILVSFRNIGLVMIEKNTKRIRWVMGRKRNDIVNLEQNKIGLFQHHARYLKDGSFTIFDNYGCEDDFSRVCRYWIEGNKVTGFKEYRTEHPRSLCMGSAQHLRGDTFLICYGGMAADQKRGYLAADPAFEIYDFSKGESLASLTFDQKYDCYQVECILVDRVSSG